MFTLIKSLFIDLFAVRYQLSVTLSLAFMFLISCTTITPTQRVALLAHEAGLSDIIIRSAVFEHHLLMNQAASGKLSDDLLLIFFEGDGLPWIKHGNTPAKDPTPRTPLALNLLLNTPQPAWYITRPCYNELREHCQVDDWTHGRYSQRIVNSMTSAIRSQLAQFKYKKIILIGYSGGGALATLVAAQTPEINAVITIAANLDIQAWSELHHYELLTTSLNPADLSALDIPQIVLSGDRDTNVPLSSISRYLKNQPHVTVKRFEQYDHVCCWQRDWSILLTGALGQLHALN